MLTVYVIPATRQGEDNIRKAVDGWIPFVKDAIVLTHSNYSQLNPDTHWKAFIYSDERISEGLTDALEDMLYADYYDFYSLYRRALDGKPSEGPRIFKSKIPLKDGSIMPQSQEGLRWTHILNGWVLEQD